MFKALKVEFDQYLKNNPQGIAFRSCWNCNSAHVHLKTVDYPIWCFGCNKIFFHGEQMNITIPKVKTL